jgi:hypothetical protein
VAQVQALKVIFASLVAKGNEREWLNHQSSGDLVSVFDRKRKRERQTGRWRLLIRSETTNRRAGGANRQANSGDTPTSSRFMDRQAGRQTDKTQTDRQTHTHTQPDR